MALSSHSQTSHSAQVRVNWALGQSTMDLLNVVSLLQSMASAGQWVSQSNLIDQMFTYHAQPDWLALMRLKRISAPSFQNAQQFKTAPESIRAQTHIGQRVYRSSTSTSLTSAASRSCWAVKPSKATNESLAAADLLERIGWQSQIVDSLDQPQSILKERIKIERFVMALSPPLLDKLGSGEKLTDSEISATRERMRDPIIVPLLKASEPVHAFLIYPTLNSTKTLRLVLNSGCPACIT